MTPEEILALQTKVTKLEADLKTATEALAAEKLRSSAPRLGVTARQVEALQEQLDETRKELAALKKTPEAKPETKPATTTTEPPKRESALKDR